MAGVWRSIRTIAASSIKIWTKTRTASISGHGIKRLSAGRSCFSARDDLLRCLDNEIEEEQSPSVPSMGDFETKLTGCVATLSKITKDGSMLEIRLDANNSTEIMIDQLGEEQGREEGSVQGTVSSPLPVSCFRKTSFKWISGHSQNNTTVMDEKTVQFIHNPVFMPVFSVNIEKQKGSVLRFDCTFDVEEEGEEVDVADAFKIQSVSMIPARANTDCVYAVDTDFLSDELYDGLEGYIKEQGLTPEVLADLLEFYSKFEQQCYVKGFLHEVRQFMRN